MDPFSKASFDALLDGLLDTQQQGPPGELVLNDGRENVAFPGFEDGSNLSLRRPSGLLSASHSLSGNSLSRSPSTTGGIGVPLEKAEPMSVIPGLPGPEQHGAACIGFSSQVVNAPLARTATLPMLHIPRRSQGDMEGSFSSLPSPTGSSPVQDQAYYSNSPSHLSGNEAPQCQGGYLEQSNLLPPVFVSYI